MIRNRFVNRNSELALLEKLWEKPGFSLVIIYGRRRIGKTRLIMEFSRGKKTIYYLAVEAPYEQISKEFSNIVKETLNIPISGELTEVLSAIPRLTKEKILIVLDEFQYIASSNPKIVSELQRLIDVELAKSNVMLIICGSSVSFFERKLLGYKSPLFGRRESSLKLYPLKFIHLRDFFPNYTLEDLIYIYGVIGGTPAYIEKLNPTKTVIENIRDIITPGHYLYDEALNLLRQEVKEPRTYFSILAAIAEGYVRPGEIANYAKVDPRTITKYLDVLENMNIITRVKPLSFKKPVIIEFYDNYFRFWFTYIYKLRSSLEIGFIDEALEYIIKTLNEYTSKTFETVIVELLPQLYKAGIIKTKPIQFGKWWHKNLEIDLIVRDPSVSTTFIEIKWRDLSLSEAYKIANNLERKSTKTGLQSPENYYLIIIKNLIDKKTPIIDNHLIIADLNLLKSSLSTS